jgi:hypothetical protein
LRAPQYLGGRLPLNTVYLPKAPQSGIIGRFRYTQIRRWFDAGCAGEIGRAFAAYSSLSVIDGRQPEYPTIFATCVAGLGTARFQTAFGWEDRVVQ